MIDAGIVDPVLDRQRFVLEHQRESLRAVLHHVAELRRSVPPLEGEWRSPAQRRYSARLDRLDDTLESAYSELAGAVAATGTAIARMAVSR